MLQEICFEEFVSGLDNNEQLMAFHAIYWAWAGQGNICRRLGEVLAGLKLYGQTGEIVRNFEPSI